MLFSCGVEQDDCPPPLAVKFKITDSETSTNITEKGKYIIDSLKVIGIHDDTTKLNITLWSLGVNTYFYFGTNVDVNRYVINYSSGLSDTLILSYNIIDDTCQGWLMEDYSVQINNQPYCVNCKDLIIEIKK